MRKIAQNDEEITGRFAAAYAYAKHQAPQDPAGLWGDFALHYARSPHAFDKTLDEAWQVWE
jgi:hypothetical protein